MEKICKNCRFTRRTDVAGGKYCHNYKNVCTFNPPNPKHPIVRGDDFCGQFQSKNKIETKVVK